MVATLAGPEDIDLIRRMLRMVHTEPEVRRVMFDRRKVAEDAGWRALIERGVSADDLATRAAVVTVVALAFMALLLWADQQGDEPLPAVLARCLLAAPHPSRLATGVSSSGR
jgi:hypothetical protein